ncbi:hypothetical protein, partial [Salmonella enterica]|uniref:hypothetical protein n=1 Tax=Salmonella enterica TaxID=28901 RepID=UPI003CF76875
MAIGTVIASIAAGAATATTPAAEAPAPVAAASTPAAAPASGGVVELKVPAAGESITSANVASWRKKDG